MPMPAEGALLRRIEEEISLRLPGSVRRYRVPVIEIVNRLATLWR